MRCALRGGCPGRVCRGVCRQRNDAGRVPHRLPDAGHGRVIAAGGRRSSRSRRRHRLCGHDRGDRDRGTRPHRVRLAGTPGRADTSCGRSQRTHRRRGERRLAGRHALGGRRRRRAAVLVRRSGDGRRTGRCARRRSRARGTAAYDASGTTRTQPFPRELPRGERRTPLRRRSVHGLPGLRAQRDRAALRVRARPQLHDVSDRGADAVVGHVPARRHARGVGACHQYRCSCRIRSGPVLRVAASDAPGPSAQGAQGLCQGLARAGRDDHRRPRSRAPRLRLLGAGPGRLGRRAGAAPRDVQPPVPGRCHGASADGRSMPAGTNCSSAVRQTTRRFVAACSYPTPQVGDRESSCRTTSNP